MKHFISLGLAASIFGASFPCWGVDYFPSEPGPSFVFDYGPVELSVVNTNQIWRNICPGCFIGRAEIFQLTTGGDVLFVGELHFNDAAPDPSGSYYDPPLELLKFPLVLGKTWVNESETWPIWGGEYLEVIWTAEVLGPKTVNVHAGQFEVIAIKYDLEYPLAPHMNATSEKWFHIQLGPINGLVSWTGVVPVENSSWGAVKAMYR